MLLDDGIVAARRRLQWRGRRWRLELTDVLCLLMVSMVMVLAVLVVLHGAMLGSMNSIETGLKRAGNGLDAQYLTYADIGEGQRKMGYSVQATPRGFVIDGRKTLLLSGSVHYPRSTPSMWKDVLLKARHDGLNMVQLYVFWNLHEPRRGLWIHDDNANVTRFLETAAEMGLFVHLRVGPYVCAEWTNGGLPLWLDTIPGMKARSNNLPWKQEMTRMVTHVMEIARPFLASRGGPVILAQIENEYTGDDFAYVDWCGQLAASLHAGIPWVMCNGRAANNTVLACNGNDCTQFAHEQSRNRPNEPLVWTEDEGWYESWAKNPDNPHPEQDDDRSASEVAYAVARWFALGGSMHNYYMYHGGNNYGRSASAGVTTMYADGVNLHADALSHEPKRSHLRRLHESLIACSDILMVNERQIDHPQPLMPGRQAYVYGTKSSGRVVFLENDADNAAIILFENVTYMLAARSVMILKNDKVQFSTSDTTGSYPYRQHRMYSTLVTSSDFSWNAWRENRSRCDGINNTKPLEQLSLTNDDTDYLLYETNFTVNTNTDSDSFEQPHNLTLSFTSCDANAFLVFLDLNFVTELYVAYPGENCSRTFETLLPLPRSGDGREHRLTLLSVSIGIHSLGLRHRKGLTGRVVLNSNQDLVDSRRTWRMTPALVGEKLRVFDSNRTVPWKPVETHARRNEMMWYRSAFQLPTPLHSSHKTDDEDITSILLDCKGLTRGRIYINGHDLGRYWMIKSQTRPEEFIQRYYHIPADWLQRSHSTNELVIFDELGGSLADVRIVASTVVDLAREAVSQADKGQSDALAVA